MMTTEAIPDRILAPVTYHWGDVGFSGVYQPTKFSPSALNRIGVGSSLERSGRADVDTLVIDDFSGGFLPKSQIGRFGDFKNHYYINQGYITHIPGVCTLSYENVTDADFISGNFSGIRAANKRMHSAMFNGIWVGFLDTTMMLSTSTSDQTLKVPATADGVTEKVTAVAVVIANSTRYLVTAGSTTDDVQGTTDPTQDTVSWTKIVTLSDTPYINGIVSLPNVGPGVNVLVGRPSTALGKGHFFFKQTDSLPATPSACALASTKDVQGSTTTTGSSVDLAVMGVDNDSASAEAAWFTVSGGSATTGVVPASGTTGTVYFGNGNFSAYPKGRRVTGIQVVVAHVEDHSSANIHPRTVRIRAGGSSSISLSDGLELGSTGTDTYGGSSVTGGLNITTDDLDELIIELNYEEKSTGSGTHTMTVSDVDVTITYASDGTNPTVSLGGSFHGTLQSSPNTAIFLEPVSDDMTGITVERRPVYYTYDWDSSTERVLISNISYPAVKQPNTGLACPFQQGAAFATGQNETVFDTVLLAVTPTDVRNLGFPGIHGTKEQTITRMSPQGNALLVEVADTDGTNAQLWMYKDQSWHAYGVMQSIESAIATEPVLWAETTLNTRLGYSYRFFPVSTTHLASATEFVAPNINDDPHLFNTSKVKTDGSPYIQTLMYDGGVPEASKSMLTLEMQTRYLDDDTAYGSVNVKIDTARDPSFTTPAVNMTFGGGSGETPGFTKYNIANLTTYVPGIAYKTFQVRLAAGHTNGSDNTPNLLPLVIEFVGDFEDTEEVRILCRPKDQNLNIVEIVEQLKTAKKTRVVQRLLGGHFNHPATFIDAILRYESTPGTNIPTEKQVDYAELLFRVTPGSTTTNGVTA